MNEMKQLNEQITKITLALGLVVGVAGGIVFQDWKVILGILIGSLTGLIGYFMIVQMAMNLPDNEKTGNRTGIINYGLRYAVYTGIFAICVFYLHISVISLLVGILSHKGSIYIYSIKEKRKGG